MVETIWLRVRFFGGRLAGWLYVCACPCVRRDLKRREAVELCPLRHQVLRQELNTGLDGNECVCVFACVLGCGMRSVEGMEKRNRKREFPPAWGRGGGGGWWGGSLECSSRAGLIFLLSALCSSSQCSQIMELKCYLCSPASLREPDSPPQYTVCLLYVCVCGTWETERKWGGLKLLTHL